MKKLALFALMTLAGLSLASGLRSESHAPVVAVSPDIPPPDCAPDCNR